MTVSINLRHEVEEDEFPAFTFVSVDVLVRGEKAGEISGTVVNRQRIPERYFLSTMDGYSGDLQYVGVSLFEPHLGRTKVPALLEGGDNDEFDFLYISKFHTEPQHRSNGTSDVGEFSPRKLLHHPFIKGRAFDNVIEGKKKWNISVLAGFLYLNSMEQSLREKEQKETHMDALARMDANQFLRNGFFRDEAVAKLGGNAPRFALAAYNHWKEPLKSHAEAAAVKFYVAPPTARPPTDKNAEILALAKSVCGEVVVLGVSSNNLDQAASFRTQITRLINESGSLSRSNALHAACANRDRAIVQCILQMDPSCVNVRDSMNMTPLMVAAEVAAGSATIKGIPDQPVIDLLLTAGAQREALNSNGKTAYGIFKARHNEYGVMLQAMTGGAVTGGSHGTPGLSSVEAKLMPAGGPTDADLRGGKGTEAGFVDYAEEDADFDGYGDY